MVQLASARCALFAAAAFLGCGQASAAVRDYSIHFDPATTTCGFYVRSGVCSTATLITPVTAVAGDVFHIQVTTSQGAPLVVPGSSESNGIYVDVYDRNATFGPGGPGPIEANSILLPLGLVTSANVPPDVNSSLSRSFDYAATAGYTATYGTPNNGFSVTGMDATITVVTPDPLPTVGVSAGYYWTTNDVPAALALLGGTPDAPTILPSGLVGKVTGSIGDPGGPTKQYYNFEWLGGIFQTGVSVNGAPFGSEFTTQLKSIDGVFDNSFLLNDANNFMHIFSYNLASGRYLIGISAGPVVDPEFTFDFITPVGVDSAVPEPATWAMMILGFGAVGCMVRNSRRRDSIGVV
jgi:hypothetical protein